MSRVIIGSGDSAATIARLAALQADKADHAYVDAGDAATALSVIDAARAVATAAGAAAGAAVAPAAGGSATEWRGVTLYLDDAPGAEIVLDALGRFVSAPATRADLASLPDGTAALTAVSARDPLLLYLDAAPGAELAVAADGRLLAASPDSESLAAIGDGAEALDQIAARDALLLWLDGRGGTLDLAADGRILSTGGGPGGLAPPAIAWSFALGSDYTTDQSLSVWDEDCIAIVGGVGQSFMDAAAAGDAAGPYSTTPRDPGYALMPAPGVVPKGAAFTTLADLQSTYPATPAKEHPFFEMANVILASMQARFGFKRPIAFFGAAHSGYEYFRIARGSDTWIEFERCLTQTVAAIRALGKTPLMAAVAVAHGEADAVSTTARTTYKRSLLQLHADITGLVHRLIPEQTEPVRMVGYAANRATYTGTIRTACGPVAWHELSRDLPHLFGHAGPTYARELAGDAHPTVLGYRQIGADFGDAFVDLVLGDGNRALVPLRVVPLTASSVRIEVNVPRGGVLVRDESGAIIGYPSDTAAYNYLGPPPAGQESSGRDGGFTVRDVAGAFGVVSATVNGASAIDVTFSRAYGAGAVLSAASLSQAGGTAGSRADGARSIFRGSIGRSIPDSDEVLYPWLAPVELQINAVSA